MNCVDSSAWLEYLGDGPNAAEFADAIEDTDRLLVPALVAFEVFKRVRQLTGESAGLDAAGIMTQGEIVALDAPLALDAARISLDLGLAMADSVILATARARSAVLWTQDPLFEGLAGVEYRAWRPPGA